MQRRELSRRGDLEYCATPWGADIGAGAAADPAKSGCPVEVPVGALNQPRVRLVAVRTITFGAKAVKRSQVARRGDFEDYALAILPSTDGCPVEVPVKALHQIHFSLWGITVGSVEIRKGLKGLCRRGHRSRYTEDTHKKGGRGLPRAELMHTTSSRSRALMFGSPRKSLMA